MQIAVNKSKHAYNNFVVADCQSRAPFGVAAPIYPKRHPTLSVAACGVITLGKKNAKIN